MTRKQLPDPEKEQTVCLKSCQQSRAPLKVAQKRAQLTNEYKKCADWFQGKCQTL
jgi:hypothetical protein